MQHQAILFFVYMCLDSYFIAFHVYPQLSLVALCCFVAFATGLLQILQGYFIGIFKGNYSEK